MNSPRPVNATHCSVRRHRSWSSWDAEWEGMKGRREREGEEEGERKRREKERRERRGRKCLGRRGVLVTLAVAMFPTTSTQGEALLVCNC